MIKILFSPILLLIFTSCSFQTPQNKWQYSSSNAFSSYTKNFLSSNDLIAKNDLKRAIKNAKQSADLRQLAKIYLGECALNISVGIDNECKKYKDIKQLVDSKELDAYYDFIMLSLDNDMIKYLPIGYQEFARNFKNQNQKALNRDIQNMKKPTSLLLSAAIARDLLDAKSLKHIIDTASFNGYKRSVIFWLHESMKFTTQKEQIQKIKQKIDILHSK